jgi:hypothetical protein
MNFGIFTTVETLIYSKQGILVICQNNLNEFWDFYHSRDTDLF